MSDDASSRAAGPGEPASPGFSRRRSVLLVLGGLCAAVATTGPLQRKTFSIGYSGLASTTVRVYTATRIHFAGPLSVLDVLLPAGLLLAVVGALGWWRGLQGRAARRATAAVAVVAGLVWVPFIFPSHSSPLVGLGSLLQYSTATTPQWGAYLGVVGSVMAVAGALANPARSPAMPVVTAASVPCPRGHLMPPWFERCSACRARMSVPARSGGGGP